MIRATARLFTHIAKRYLPDAFLFSVLLTFVVFFSGMLLERRSPLEMTSYWGEGIWSLLTFAMQMVLILVTGHTLAHTKGMQRVLQWIAERASTPGSSIRIVTLTAIIACWLNWGFGLIIGGLLANELAKRVRGVHYPLLVASAYSGFLVWHGGLSGSIPLQLATGSDLLTTYTGGEVIPVSETVFTPMNLLLSAVLLITLPLLNRMMHPLPEEVIEVDPLTLTDSVKDELPPENPTPAERLEHSSLLSILLGALGSLYIGIYFSNGGGFTLNSVNLIFLTLGILFHKTPANFLKHFNHAVHNCGGIILQYPLYAGIMGMMVHSGLAETLSQWFVEISTERTFPLLSFLSAGLVNFFVPSGGGQWAVQGPILVPAGMELNVPVAKTAMAIAWGDAWTNMLQPFWALPLLAIARLGVRDIMGYCTVILLWSGAVISLFFLLF